MQSSAYRFQVGDEVRLAPGTSLWGDHPNLHDMTGVVVRHVDDGTSAPRIDVAFGGETIFPGMHEGSFKPA